MSNEKLIEKLEEMIKELKNEDRDEKQRMKDTGHNVDNEVIFDIQIVMKSRWVDDFCSMLKYMEKCGDIGHSSLIGFYADGDGDFRPKFNICTDFKMKEGIRKSIVRKPEVIYDAG